MLVDFVRRRSSKDKSDKPVRIEAIARYIVEDSKVNSDDVWEVLTRPLKERYVSWHPSYGDLIPTVSDSEGKPIEFEVVGSAGGRYTWRIVKCNDSAKVLKLWKGPSKNPPGKGKNSFLGLNYEFHVRSGIEAPIIDIIYQERWSNNPWPTEDIWFKNGPYREVHWIFSKFPIKGKVDYVHVRDRSAVK